MRKMNSLSTREIHLSLKMDANKHSLQVNIFNNFLRLTKWTLMNLLLNVHRLWAACRQQGWSLKCLAPRILRSIIFWETIKNKLVFLQILFQTLWLQTNLTWMILSSNSVFTYQRILASQIQNFTKSKWLKPKMKVQKMKRRDVESSSTTCKTKLTSKHKLRTQTKEYVFWWLLIRL